MVWIPDSHSDLLKDETKAFGCMATLMNDGSPQLTPIWFNADGKYILINTAKGRVKEKNMRRDPRVAFMIIDPNNPYRYIQVFGKVVGVSIENAREHIDKLAKKYRGVEKYSSANVNEIRVSFKILPEKINVH